MSWQHAALSSSLPRLQVGQHLAASHQSLEAATLLCYILKCYYAVMQVGGMGRM